MRISRRLAAAALALALGLATAGPVRAQTTSASVSGMVRDSQGGALPGATVTLTSATQGNILTAITDGEGNFLFPYVRPDTYVLKIVLEGFQTFERRNLQVNANDKFSAGIFAMQLGLLTESITVEGRQALVQAESGERSFTLESKAIEHIAVNGRSFFPLATLVPGVVPVMGGEVPTQVSNMSANGMRPNSNNFTVDGISNVDTGDNGGNMSTTNIEAVSEFKILTSSYQAEYGRAVGAQISVVTKSGTQNFSGSGYWYGRRSDWNANTWTNNRSGIEKPEASRNDSGYTIGGPVFIPGRFNEQKNKLFFFFAQEYQRRKDPVAEVRTTVPTALERIGDFSQSVDANGNPFPFIRDAATGLPCHAGDTSGCFRDGGVVGRIPQDRLYQPTLAALGLFPLPNVAGEPGHNYTSQTPNQQPRREELIRLDYQASNNWRFTGRLLHNQDTRELPYGVAWAAGSNGVDTSMGRQDIPGYNWVTSATGVLNQTTSLEVSVGSAHNSLDIYLTNPSLKRSASAVGQIPMPFPDAVQDDWIPHFLFGGGRVANPARFITQQTPFSNFNTTYDVTGNVTKILGSHAIKTGVFYQRSLKDQSAFAPFNGQIDFANNANNPFDSGHPYANAAIGVFDSFQQASTYAKPKWRYSNLEWFIQDNWKTTSRLTFDYGVRFYYVTPQWDVSRQASNFLPDQYDSSEAVRLFQPATVGGSRVGFDPVTGATVPSAFIGRIVPNSGNRFNGAFQAGDGIDETLTTGAELKVSPRLGAAYDVFGDQSTVVRGGFGIFFDRPQGNLVFNLINNPPGVTVQNLNWGLVKDAVGATPLHGVVNLQPSQYDFELPTVYQWNVGVQRKLPLAFTMDIAYVGSESRELPQGIQINSVPYGAAFRPENQDPTRPASAIPGAQALDANFLRPYRGYGNIAMLDYSAFSNYHALQTALNRRFDRGLLVGLTYTWSKALGVVDTDFAGGRPDGEAANRRANYAPLAFDRPHVFTANFVYQLPTFAGGALGHLTNDWQISGIYRAMTGVPYPINFSIPGITAVNLTGSDGNNNARVVLTGDPGPGATGDPYRMLDTSVFAPPQPGSLGFESARFFVYGPGLNSLDLSVSKSVRIGGRVRAEIRLDAFNALNHTQFSGVNSTVNFRSLTDPTITNLPYDSTGSLVNRNGFGTVNGVRPARELQLVTRLSF